MSDLEWELAVVRSRTCVRVCVCACAGGEGGLIHIEDRWWAFCGEFLRCVYAVCDVCPFECHYYDKDRASNDSPTLLDKAHTCG